MFLIEENTKNRCFCIYLRNKDSQSHFVTTLRNITACSIQLLPISFLGQNSHGPRNTATCLALLTKVVAPLLAFTNIYKESHTNHSLLRKTQNTEKTGHFLKIVMYFDQYLHKKEGQSDNTITFVVFNVAILLEGLCSGSRIHF